MIRRAFAVLSVVVAAGAAQAQDGVLSDPETGTETASAPAPPFSDNIGRRRIGYGRLFTNDIIGDGKDRWRTGSITTSRVYGYGWDGAPPTRLFDLLELRLQGQVIAPTNLQINDPNDRRYAGVLSVGMHSHSSYGDFELSLGGDLVFVGPQTHVDELHKTIHDLLGEPEPSAAVLANQIGNTIRPTAVAEVGRTLPIGGASIVRPFAEARAGDESLFRVGADFTFGLVGQNELLVRESVTGQRYRVIYDSEPGTSFTFGGDIAYVGSSVYLPKNGGARLKDQRERLRAGFHWQGRNASAFYGLTYLGKEFEQQFEGQITGSLRLKLRF